MLAFVGGMCGRDLSWGDVCICVWIGGAGSVDVCTGEGGPKSVFFINENDHILGSGGNLWVPGPRVGVVGVCNYAHR